MMKIGKKQSYRAIAQNLIQKGESYHAAIPAYWMQGRTVYGGLTSALALASVNAAFEGLPPLRSMIVNFTGPVGDTPEFIPSILRRGRNMTSVGVDVRSEGKLAARIVFSFGVIRESDLSVAPPPIAINGPPDSHPDFTPKLLRPVVPKFFLNFETKLAGGHRPVTRAQDGYILTWSRHKAEDSRHGADSLVAIADVLPPAALPLAKKFAPISSAQWMLNILTDDLTTSNGWWLLDTRLTNAQNGYSSQRMNVWNARGELIAEGMQSVALFF